MVDLGQISKTYLLEICEHNLLIPSPEWLTSFVHPEVIHNSRKLGIQQYKHLITTNIVQPDTHINPEKIMSADDHVSARLIFTGPPTCTSYLSYNLKPAKDRICYDPCGMENEARRGDGTFDVDENVIYRYVVDERDGKWKIKEVWSVVDLEPVKGNSA